MSVPLHSITPRPLTSSTQMVLLHIDPEGKTIFKDSQPPTGQFILTGGGGGTNRSQDKTLDTVPLTAPAIRARITELQEQLALLEVHKLHSCSTQTPINSPIAILQQMGTIFLHTYHVCV